MSTNEATVVETSRLLNREVVSTPVRKIQVDLWKTGLHWEKIGIKKKEQHRAKTSHYTADMNLIGAIKEEGEEIGHVGIRESTWKVELLEKRLIIKLFSDNIIWQGTIEEMTSQEVRQSFAGRHNYPCYNIILDDYDYVINLLKVRGGIWHPEWYCFSYIHPDGTIEVFTIRAKLGVGPDFRVRSVFNPKKDVAIIDGKKFDIGGRWEIRFYNEELAQNRFIPRILILFAATIRYHGTIYKKTKKILKLMNKGQYRGKISGDELRLLKNPRKPL